MNTPSCRRASFSLDEKRRVLDHLRASGRVRETINQFYPQLPPESYDARRRLVLNWRRNARKILQGAATRQGAARKRMRRAKNQKPKPPRPRGLEQEMELEEEPILSENEDVFEPIVLKRGRSKTSETQIRQHPAQDETQYEDQYLDQIQDQNQDGLQGLIASAVAQSVTTQHLREVEEIETGSGPDLGHGSDVQDGNSDSDLSNEEGRTAETMAVPTVKTIKRTSFSLDEKRRVLEHLASTKNVRETIEKFYPELPPEEFKSRRRTIWTWRQSTEQIVAGCADDKASARKKMRPRGIVCQRVPRHVVAQDVVDRLLSTANKSQQKRNGYRELRPAPPTSGLLPERQIDTLVFSALGLPPTQFPLILPAPAISDASASTAVTMRPLERGEAAFAIRRR